MHRNFSLSMATTASSAVDGYSLIQFWWVVSVGHCNQWRALRRRLFQPNPPGVVLIEHDAQLTL